MPQPKTLALVGGAVLAAAVASTVLLGQRVRPSRPQPIVPQAPLRVRASRPPLNTDGRNLKIRWIYNFSEQLSRVGTFTLSIDAPNSPVVYSTKISAATKLQALCFTTVIDRTLAQVPLKARVTDDAGKFEDAYGFVLVGGYVGTNDALGLTVTTPINGVCQ